MAIHLAKNAQTAGVVIKKHKEEAVTEYDQPRKVDKTGWVVGPSG